METQAIADVQSPFEDTIESFGENNNAAEDHIQNVPPARENGDEMDCECGIDVGRNLLQLVSSYNGEPFIPLGPRCVLLL